MNKHLKVFAVATILSMAMPFAVLAEDGQNQQNGNNLPPRGVMPLNRQRQGDSHEGQGDSMGRQRQQFGNSSTTPEGQKPKMRLPSNLSDECKTDLQSAMDSHDQQLNTQTQANKQALADLMKAKRKALRAQEDLFITARRALEDTLDNAMGAAATSTDVKTAQQTFRKAMSDLSKDNNKKVRAIEQDFQKQMQALNKTNPVTKPELPDSCKDEASNLGNVKGAFIVNKKK